MKKALSLLIGTAAVSTSVFATNGTQLIATTAKARAMGGVGVATYMGAGASNNNPALYSKEKGMTISGGLTYFSPTVTYQDQGGKDTSSYDSSLLPDIGYAHKINDDMAIGVGLTASGGMGVDYSVNGDTAASGAQNELKVVQIAIPFSYNLSGVGAEGLSLGIAPVIQSSSLATNFGDESSMDFGVNLGASYDMDALTFGFLYKIAIESDYGNAFFKPLANPSVLGLGVNWGMSKTSSFAFDYKLVGYGSASGYSDMGWSDQSVIALGYEYLGDKFAIRAGLNYGSNIIDSASPPETVATYIGFPAVTAAHATFGGGYSFKESGRIDAAFVYGASFSDSYTYNDPTNSNLPTLVKATNNQTSITVDYTYAF